MIRVLLAAVVFAAALTLGGAGWMSIEFGQAFAETGQPYQWQMGMQPAASPVMERIHAFHNQLLWLITGIVLFVLVLLIYVMVRFSERFNPVPSTTTHGTLIEVIWTVVPIFILLAIAVPSFRLLYFQHAIPEAAMTIKATGNQWYWSYEYPDEGIEFDSVMLTKEEAAEKGLPGLLATDTQLVLPVDTDIRMLVTASDVLHAWTIPAFGMKMDAVPGRVNENWFRATQTGTFYGQCSELCGMRHAFMPITVEIVTLEEYQAWLVGAKEEYAMADAPSTIALAPSNAR